MRRWELESILRDVGDFENPQVQWEQYATSPELAAQILMTIQSEYGDIEGKAIADLGVGSGRLTVGSIVLGSSYNIGFDIDPEALELARVNFEEFEMEVDLVRTDITALTSSLVTTTLDRDAVGAETGDESALAEGLLLQQRRGSQSPVDLEGSSGSGLSASELDSEGSSSSSAAGSPDGNLDNSPSMPRPSTYTTAAAIGSSSAPESSSPPQSSSVPSSQPAVQPAATVPGDRRSEPDIEWAWRSCVDVVITNPPFGTKRAGVDMAFLAAAIRMARHAVYSLHKSSTRDHVVKVGRELGAEPELVAQLAWDLPATYSFHKDSNRTIEVDLIRFDTAALHSVPPTAEVLREFVVEEFEAGWKELSGRGRGRPRGGGGKKSSGKRGNRSSQDSRPRGKGGRKGGGKRRL